MLSTQSAPMLPKAHDEDAIYLIVFPLVSISISQGFIIVNAILLLDSVTGNLLGLLRFWMGFTAITVIIFLQGIRSAYKDGSQISTYRTILAVVVLEVEPLVAWVYWGDEYLQILNDPVALHPVIALYILPLMLIIQGSTLHRLDMVYCGVTSDAMTNRDKPLGGQDTIAGQLYGAITGKTSQQR